MRRFGKCSWHVTVSDRQSGELLAGRVSRSWPLSEVMLALNDVRQAFPEYVITPYVIPPDSQCRR